MSAESQDRPDFAALRGSWRDEETSSVDEGLRERKKRLTRSLISDTATMMFLQRGFDNVKITEVAAACGVSEKTIYNYFPTKESLVLDNELEMTEAIKRVLGSGPERLGPVEGMTSIIREQTRDLVTHVRSARLDDVSVIRSFMDMMSETPALRAAMFDVTERLAQVAARVMAERAGLDPQDPEPQIAADALLGLWRMYYRTMAKYATLDIAPEEFERLVLAEVDRAGRLIDTGLWSFAMTVQGTDSRDQLRAAAEASNEARKQVVRALKEAKSAWLQVRNSIADQAREPSSRDDDSEYRYASRRSAHELRTQAQLLKREVRQAKQEFREEIRQQAKDVKRAVRKK